jgi:hypothetical protein
MPKFHLHLINAIGVVPDEEGQEFDDLSAAREEAILGIRSLIAEDASTGVVDLGGRIEIADRDQRVVMIVPFADAVEVRLDP